MPKAKQLCSNSKPTKCLKIATSDGRCKDHQLRKPWSNISIRNRNRPTDWKSRRAYVLRRDRKCRKCGSTDDLEVDHRLPVAFGGTWDYANLWVLCKSCHKRKTFRDVRK